jgi:DNA-binding SARP family transcriptional activator
LDLGPSQQRALLALLIRANQLVSDDDIIDLLWGQDPPGSALNTIHKYIGSIRRLLEPGLEARASGRWLTRRSGAYRLAIDDNMSDLIAFRRTAKDAWSARMEGRPADALDLYLEVLALRRGVCGEDLDLHGRNRDYFTTVDQEYVTAVARAADAALASAQASQILPLLRQASFSEPLNESLQARLILVLAATGQQAPALSHYQSVRARLSDELGIDPGAEMRGALDKILRQELPSAASGHPADPAVTPGPADPPGGQSVSGGPSRGGPAPPVPPAQLPADLPTFAGRESELAELVELLHPGRVARRRRGSCHSSSTRLSLARSAATASPSALNSWSVMPRRRRAVNTTSEPLSSEITLIGT